MSHPTHVVPLKARRFGGGLSAKCGWHCSNSEDFCMLQCTPLKSLLQVNQLFHVSIAILLFVVAVEAFIIPESSIKELKFIGIASKPDGRVSSVPFFLPFFWIEDCRLRS